ncbi:methyltransferase domain-containing protein [Mycobacterium sp. CVI_P3]|uniref:Methyltransferase domain-containing protein n=1 Tax=Mycobacterium pinniadriaticum TaxID=2994102 RepID=A0ABT3SJB4_9MYCO|nr:methyltransferase domain-containing protein [Mycobacterium pinniadriaticum]MCX2933195.1 methyltransferase domain-containing protein [Mycobacterium pinniadriaticum]MCX2939617.1 methyltransferase domain-containing protein [Mycobacterium pinniadriaticum]
MLGQLYDRALTGERCWLRHDDGRVHRLPVHSWLGGHGADTVFDSAVVALCNGPTIDLGCGPGRLVAHLVQRGIPALGVDQSATAVSLARRSGAPALLRDVFEPLPGTGRWQTVLLADGNVGLAGDPRRILRRAAELLGAGGHCVVEFDPGTAGVLTRWVRLESPHSIGPWFKWASVGIDCAAALAEEVGLALVGIHQIGQRVVATLTLT